MRGKRGLKVDFCIVLSSFSVNYRQDGGGILFSDSEQNNEREVIDCNKGNPT